MVCSDSRRVGPLETLVHSHYKHPPVWSLSSESYFQACGILSSLSTPEMSLFFPSEAMPKSYAKNLSDRPSLFISSDPEPDRSLEWVSLLPVLSITTASTALECSTDGMLVRVPVCHQKKKSDGFFACVRQHIYSCV